MGRRQPSAPLDGDDDRREGATRQLRRCLGLQLRAVAHDEAQQHRCVHLHTVGWRWHSEVKVNGRAEGRQAAGETEDTLIRPARTGTCTDRTSFDRQKCFSPQICWCIPGFKSPGFTPACQTLQRVQTRPRMAPRGWRQRQRPRAPPAGPPSAPRPAKSALAAAATATASVPSACVNSRASIDGIQRNAFLLLRRLFEDDGRCHLQESGHCREAGTSHSTAEGAAEVIQRCSRSSRAENMGDSLGRHTGDEPTEQRHQRRGGRLRLG